MVFVLETSLAALDRPRDTNAGGCLDMRRSDVTPVMSLSEAAHALGQKTGKKYSERDVMYLIDDVAYAIAPEFAFDVARSRTPGLGAGPIFRSNQFKLSFSQLEDLRVQGYARITSYRSSALNLESKVGKEVEFSTNFVIKPEDVRVRVADVALLGGSELGQAARSEECAKARNTAITGEAKKPGPKPKVAALQEKVRTAAARFLAVEKEGWNSDVWPAWRVLNHPSVIAEVWGANAKELPRKLARDKDAFKDERKVNFRAMAGAVNAVRPRQRAEIA